MLDQQRLGQVAVAIAEVSSLVVAAAFGSCCCHRDLLYIHPWCFLGNNFSIATCGLVQVVADDSFIDIVHHRYKVIIDRQKFVIDRHSSFGGAC